MRDTDILNLKIVVQEERLVSNMNQDGEITRDVQIHRMRKVEELAIEINSWMKKRGSLPNDLRYTSFKILYKNQVLNMSDILAEVGV